MGYFVLGIWITILFIGWGISVHEGVYDREMIGLISILTILVAGTMLLVGVHLGELK